MRRWLRRLLIMVVLLGLMAAGAALFGPGLVRERLGAWVQAETGRLLQVGEIGVNLLALSVELRDVTLTEADQVTPFVAWRRLYVALSPSSLWHRAPVIGELQLDSPSVRIERLADGRFNYSDLLARNTVEPADPSSATEPARFSLNNLTVHGGRIEFIDRTLAPPVTHRIDQLELALPFVGNLPYLADRYVQPLLQAQINGTPFAVKGDLKPFADTREYVVKLKFDGIALPRYLAYLPARLPVTVYNGSLDVDLDLSYRVSATAKPVLQLAGRLDLTALDLREPGGRPLLFLPLLEVRLAPSHILDRDVHLTAVTFGNPQLWLQRTAGGAWNVAALATPPQRATGNKGGSPPLQLRIDRLQLRNGRLDLRDRQPPGGFATTLTAINLDVNDFGLAGSTPCQLALDLGSERGERLGLSGRMTVAPLGLDLSVAAKGIPIAAYQPYYQAQTTAAIGGQLQATARLRVTAEQPLLVSDARLEIDGLDLPLPAGEGLRFATGLLQGGSFDLGANRLEIADLAFAGADLRISRNRDGRWSFLDRNYPLLAKLAEPAGTSPPPAPGQPPFSYRIGRLVLRDGAITVRDHQPADPATFAIADLGITLRDLAVPDPVPASFAIDGKLRSKGAFQVHGTATASGPTVNATVRLQRLPLGGLAPYVAARTRLVLVDGALDSSLDIKASRKDGVWRGQVSGDLGISRFYCLDAAHREDLLRWDRLQLGGIDARLDPPAVRIKTVALSDYYARVLLDEQARLNFADIAAPPPVPAAEPQTAASAATTPALPPAPPPPAAAPGPEIHIDKVTLQGGKVLFTDRHLPRPFTAEMLQLGGRITGLSSVPGSRAEVDLRGRLRNESPLFIAGTLNPLAKPLFLDLKLDFTDIELSPLSPYSGTYVGYLIERGKLNVALAYRVQDGRLQATNQLFLDQFTFGAAVESERATSLPVRLAVALLKDRNGEIHLDIPVSGDLNDPQFSVWGIIWQIIRNLLVKAATSPLALLGALAGETEEFSIIVFPAGSAVLAEAEQAKLAKIAAALRDRADLKLEVRGYVDPERDPEGYRLELMQEALRREKLFDLRRTLGDAAPTDAANITLTAGETSEYLWRVYRAAEFPKPRNLLGMVKHLPDAELAKLLLAHITIGSEELTTLAQHRARTVAAALVEGGGIPRERVFLTTTEITAPPAAAGVSRSRVEFGIAAE